MELAIISFTG